MCSKIPTNDALAGLKEEALPKKTGGQIFVKKNNKKKNWAGACRHCLRQQYLKFKGWGDWV